MGKLLEQAMTTLTSFHSMHYLVELSKVDELLEITLRCCIGYRSSMLQSSEAEHRKSQLATSQSASRAESEEQDLACLDRVMVANQKRRRCALE